jgi:CheY-like chemotaxis protein
MTHPASNDSAQQPWLIVEDEAIVGMMVEDALASLGVQIVGPLARVSQALPIARDRTLAGAVLDINIAGTLVYPVADALLARGIPFMFLTGYGEADLPRHLQHAPLLTKPFIVDELCKAVRKLMQRP